MRKRPRVPKPLVGIVTAVLNAWRASGNALKAGGPTALLPSRADSILCSSQLSGTNPTEVE